MVDEGLAQGLGCAESAAGGHGGHGQRGGGQQVGGGLGARQPYELAGGLAEVFEEQPGQVPLAHARVGGQRHGGQVGVRVCGDVVGHSLDQVVGRRRRGGEHAHLCLVARPL
jgi:hypothetical protein